MRNYDFKAMQAHCDELTKDGKQLAIGWDGGGDSGCFYLRLDDRDMLSLSDLEDDIVEYIAEVLGYGGFDGCFSTEGSAVYDREAKCFAGEDYYTESDEDQIECSIEFDIPESVWFDGLIIETESEGSYDLLHTYLSLQIFNGPYPEDFDKIKDDMERLINNKLVQVINKLENFAGVRETYTIPRKDFEVTGEVLRGRIKNMNYATNSTETKDIIITFTP